MLYGVWAFGTELKQFIIPGPVQSTVVPVDVVSASVHRWDGNNLYAINTSFIQIDEQQLAESIISRWYAAVSIGVLRSYARRTERMPCRGGIGWLVLFDFYAPVIWFLKCVWKVRVRYILRTRTFPLFNNLFFGVSGLSGIHRTSSWMDDWRKASRRLIYLFAWWLCNYNFLWLVNIKTK